MFFQREKIIFDLNYLKISFIQKKKINLISILFINSHENYYYINKVKILLILYEK